MARLLFQWAFRNLRDVILRRRPTRTCGRLALETFTHIPPRPLSILWRYHLSAEKCAGSRISSVAFKKAWSFLPAVS